MKNKFSNTVLRLDGKDTAVILAMTKAVRFFKKGMVIIMNNQPSNNLNQLLSENNAAKEYFMSLSEQEQGFLQQCTFDIHTVDDMYRYAKYAAKK